MGIPGWFFGANAALELVATIACFLILIAGYRAFNLSHDRKFKFFGLAFFFLGISFLARTLVHLLFFKYSSTYIVKHVAELFNYGSFFYIALTLAAYLIILTVSLDIGGKKTTALLFSLAFVGIFFSTIPLKIFHLFSLIVLAYILGHYLNNYLDKKNFTALLTFLAFLLILAGHVLFLNFIYSLFSVYVIYILAHLFQLGGYMVLLWAVGRVLLK
jgi:hypothetical protein